MIPRLLLSLLLLAALLPLGACSLYRNDKMWISQEKYQTAESLYDKTGSIDLTREELEKLHWRRAEVNEAVYRLKKRYRLE